MTKFCENFLPGHRLINWRKIWGLKRYRFKRRGWNICICCIFDVLLSLSVFLYADVAGWWLVYILYKFWPKMEEHGESYDHRCPLASELHSSLHTAFKQSTEIFFIKHILRNIKLKFISNMKCTTVIQYSTYLLNSMYF